MLGMTIDVKDMGYAIMDRVITNTGVISLITEGRSGRQEMCSELRSVRRIYEYIRMGRSSVECLRISVGVRDFTLLSRFMQLQTRCRFRSNN